MVGSDEVPAGSWRERTLERSLASARVKALSRGDRYIQIALEILRETGRSDFTVQDLADRARTSLRSFYQYFSGKDDLLLAILEETVTASVDAWRAEIDGLDPLPALKIVIGNIYGGQNRTADSWVGVNRALASYHVGLAESHGDSYRRALWPMVDLMGSQLRGGVADGSVRQDVPVDQMLRVFFQMVMGAALVSTLSQTAEGRARDVETMWAMCLPGVAAPDAEVPATSAGTAARRRSGSSRR